MPRMRLLPESQTYARPGDTVWSTTTPPGALTLSGTISRGDSSVKSRRPTSVSAMRSPARPRGPVNAAVRDSRTPAPGGSPAAPPPRPQPGPAAADNTAETVDNTKPLRRMVILSVVACHDH